MRLSQPARVGSAPHGRVAVKTTAFFRRPEGSGSKGGKGGKAAGGGAARKPPASKKQQQAQSEGGGLMNMEPEVYAEAFSIDKCINLYMSIFRWLGKPLGGR